MIAHTGAGNYAGSGELQRCAEAGGRGRRKRIHGNNARGLDDLRHALNDFRAFYSRFSENAGADIRNAFQPLKADFFFQA